MGKSPCLTFGYSLLLILFGFVNLSNSVAGDHTANTKNSSQLESSARASKAQSRKELDAILVTAHKIKEDVRDVPVSMNVFDEIAIEDRLIESTKDIAPHTPNFSLIDNSGGGNFSPVMRGIKSRGGSLSTSVGMFIDGIPVLNANGFDEILMDIERIEVLKGPQGTLYGKDTEAGAINIITRQPGNTLQGKIQADLGEDNKRNVSLSLSSPLSKDRLYLGVSGRYYAKDGFIEDTLNGGQTDDREHKFGKFNLRFTPGDRLDISLISSKLERDDKDNTVNGLYGEDRKIPAQVVGFDRSKSTLHALKAAYDAENFRIESITTYRKFESINLGNYHFAPTSDFHLDSDNTYERLAQELRVTGTFNRLKWLAGLYADKDDNTYHYVQYGSYGPYPVDQAIEGDALGLFLHGDYQLTQRFSVLAGIRYDRDSREFSDPAMGLNLDKTCEEISPKLQVKFRRSADHMVYATISRGYRSGDFQPFAAPGYPKDYDPETLWNYEVGSKARFLDGRISLNAALFFMDLNDMQTKVSPMPGMSYMANVAKATAKGFELEARAKITPAWEIFAGMGYSHSEFDEYKDRNGDYQGNKNPYVPEYDYTIGTQYRGKSGIFARADFQGVGKTYFNKENTNSRDAYHLVNLKLGYEQEAYDVYLYAKNLFDKEYDAEGAHGGYFTIYSPPREIGVQAIWRF